MDGNRFDYLARSVALAACSRRATLRSAAGAAAGGVLTWFGVDDAAAGCGKIGKACDRRRDCCQGAKCKGGRCKCNKKRGFAECPGKRRCVNLRKNDGNCGICGFACPTGSSCQGGACTCADGRLACFFSGDDGECCAAGESCFINSAGEGFCRAD